MTVLSLPDLELGIELQGKTLKQMPYYYTRTQDCHLNSVAKREAFTSMSKAGQTVTGLLDKAHQDRVLENRGNFLEILNLVLEHDEIVHTHLHGAQNAKYTHSSVQNGLISIMGDLIRSDIKEEILQAEFYSIIADESKDLSKKEQMTLALRYSYENEIHEESKCVYKSILDGRFTYIAMPIA